MPSADGAPASIQPDTVRSTGASSVPPSTQSSTGAAVARSGVEVLARRRQGSGSPLMRSSVRSSGVPLSLNMPEMSNVNSAAPPPQVSVSSG